MLGNLNKEDKDTFIIGDFNLNLLKMNSSDYVNDFVTRMYASSFYPLITKPTRITKNTATLIDNIFVNNVSRISKKGILISDLSDHLPIFCTTNQALETTTQTEKNKRVINKKNINRLNEQISQTNWEEIVQIDNPETAYNNFMDKLKTIWHKSANPEVKNKETKTSTYSKPWITTGFLVSLKAKNKLYKQFLKNPSITNEEKYKKYRNKFNNLKRIAKKRYYELQVDEAKNNMKQTWNIINELIGKKSKQNAKLPSQFMDNTDTITIPNEIANRFNNYFTNVGPTLSRQIKKTPKKFTEYLSNKCQNSIFLEPITQSEVEKELMKLNPNKSSGLTTSALE